MKNNTVWVLDHHYHPPHLYSHEFDREFLAGSSRYFGHIFFETKEDAIDACNGECVIESDD